MVVADHHRLHLPSFREAERAKIAAEAIALARMKEPTVLHGRARAQDLAPRAFDDVVVRIEAEPSQRHGAADRLGLGRDNRGDTSTLQAAEDLAVGIAGIRGHRGDGSARRRRCGVQSRKHLLAFVHLPGGHLQIEHHTHLIVDDAMLLVVRLEAPVTTAGGHAGIRISRADLLELTGLLGVAAPAQSLLVLCQIDVLGGNRVDVADHEAV